MRDFALGLVAALLGAALAAALMWGWLATGASCPDAPPGWLGFCETAV